MTFKCLVIGLRWEVNGIQPYFLLFAGKRWHSTLNSYNLITFSFCRIIFFYTITGDDDGQCGILDSQDFKTVQNTFWLLFAENELINEIYNQTNEKRKKIN